MSLVPRLGRAVPATSGSVARWCITLGISATSAVHGASNGRGWNDKARILPKGRCRKPSVSARPWAPVGNNRRAHLQQGAGVRGRREPRAGDWSPPPVPGTRRSAAVCRASPRQIASSVIRLRSRWRHGESARLRSFALSERDLPGRKPEPVRVVPLDLRRSRSPPGLDRNRSGDFPLMAGIDDNMPKGAGGNELRER